MITYVVRQGGRGGWYVVVKESGVVIAGPFADYQTAEDRKAQLGGRVIA